MTPPRLHIFKDTGQLVDALYHRVDALSRAGIAQRGRFSVILAGGTTPRELYRRLRTLDTEWERWHIYFGDERYLPAGHPERNDTMVADAWLDHVPVPAGQVHRVPVTGSPAAAAAEYSSVLSQASGFDLALLGLGEDGHTASLFPGDNTSAVATELAIAVLNAPKPPPQRVSLSAACLGTATAVWFIISGEPKRCALQSWLDGEPLPAQWINPRAGVDVFTDIAVGYRALE